MGDNIPVANIGNDFLPSQSNLGGGLRRRQRIFYMFSLPRFFRFTLKTFFTLCGRKSCVRP